MPEKAISAKKKGFTMPHTFVILIIIIAIAVVLTWIIPSGEYARIEDPVSGSTVVDATSFQYVENVTVNPLQVPMIIVQAFADNGGLITLILLSGGAIYMLTAAGALQALVAMIVRRFSNRVEVFIPLLMLVFALICTTQAVNTFIGFAPITVMLALSLGLDSIVGVGIILLGGAVGFSTGTLNVSTTLVAQKIAELPNYSGIGYRWVCFVVYYIVTCFWLVRYAKKIKKNPQLSPMYDLDQNSEFKNGFLDDFGHLDTRKSLCILALVVALVVIVYGCINLAWDFAEQSAVFLVLAVVVGIIAGFDMNKICVEFLNGTKKMLAAAVMPIMIPLSDLLGVIRQTCILSFNFGDGFCNYILPTSTALMGILSAGNVPYDRWMRFMWKMFLIWFVVGAVLVVIAQLMNYGPM